MKAFLPAAALLLILTACSKQDTTTRPLAEIRGQPINSPTSTPAAAPTSTPDRNLQAASTASTPASATTPTVPALAATPSPSAPAATNTPLTTPLELQNQNGYTRAGFDKLSAFHYIMPDEISDTNKPPADQFPAAVRALDQKPVAIRGFMLPLKVDKGVVTEMLIMKDQSMCCYGTSPKINEWITVKMNDKGVKPIMDQPVTLFGKLHVGEQHENGYLVGIYQLDGEKMEWE